MKAITEKEAVEWCTRSNLIETHEFSLKYKAVHERKFFVTAPAEHRRIAYLASQILCFRGEANFSGGLLWLRRWDIGSQIETGWLVLESIRRIHGEPRPLEVAPGQIFRDDEFLEAHAFLIQVMAFGWVAEYVPNGSGFFLRFKDTGQVSFSAQSTDTLEELRAAFSEWQPTNVDPMVVKQHVVGKTRRKR